MPDAMKTFYLFCGPFLLLALAGNAISSPLANSDCVCGESNVDHAGRIVNGVRTTPNKYPWMAGLFAPRGYFMCGGSIISSKNIITAGHCVYYMTDQLRSTWRLGMHSLKNLDGIKYRTANYELHPYFSNSTFYDDFDIALATLKTTITFNHNIKPICLPLPGNDYVGRRATVAGWGKLGEGKRTKTADVLMETKVWIKSDEACNDMTKHLVKYNTDSMICAHEDKTDACQGDSGGPIFIETEPNRYEIFGTVSFGDGCARDFPGVYSKVATVTTLDWIKDYIERTEAKICIDPPRLRFRKLFMPYNSYLRPVTPYVRPFSPVLVG